MYQRLNTYITKADILIHSQHGFQSDHSPFMPLISMQDKISKAIQEKENEYSIGIFFDLAKTFDMVNLT